MASLYSRIPYKGQVEANIPHLKFLKRQKYGKTSFELLHRGALNAA